jgi:hypothetical protein
VPYCIDLVKFYRAHFYEQAVVDTMYIQILGLPRNPLNSFSLDTYFKLFNVSVNYLK